MTFNWVNENGYRNLRLKSHIFWSCRPWSPDWRWPREATRSDECGRELSCCAVGFKKMIFRNISIVFENENENENVKIRLFIWCLGSSFCLPRCQKRENKLKKKKVWRSKERRPRIHSQSSDGGTFDCTKNLGRPYLFGRSHLCTKLWIPLAPVFSTALLRPAQPHILSLSLYRFTEAPCSEVWFPPSLPALSGSTHQLIKAFRFDKFWL